MTGKDRQNVVRAACWMMKLHKLASEEKPGDVWHKHEYKQGVQDCLNALKNAGVIVDYDLEIIGVKMER